MKPLDIKKLEMKVRTNEKETVSTYANEQEVHDKINTIIDILYVVREENVKLHNRLSMVEQTIEAE